jgi:hypothetical protein
MSVSVDTSVDKAFKSGSPAELFTTQMVEASGATQRPVYAVSPDGQRFLMNVPAENPTLSPITVVLNWNPHLKK